MTIKVLALTAVLLLNGVIAWAQEKPVLKVKEHYEGFTKDNCIQLYPHEDINQIVLIRHGEPNIDKKGWRNREEAVKYIYSYDSVGVIPFDFIPLCVPFRQDAVIYHSPLPRAKHTASLLFGYRQMIEDVRFREFERKVFRFINVKLPLGFWIGTSRILWLMGMNKRDIESFKNAKKRAKDNALFLISQADTHGVVVLVAHGFHNKYVMKYLQHQGWKKVRKDGNGYLAVNVLAKPK